MNRSSLLAIAAGIAAASLGAVPVTAPKSPGGRVVPATSRFEMQSRTGTLRTYSAGKSVVFAGPDGRVKRLPVDPAARVDRGLVRGQQVNVISMTDETGRERVSAISRSAAAPAESAAASTPNPQR